MHDGSRDPSVALNAWTILPFGKMYPAKWMRQVYDRDDDRSSYKDIGLCSSVDGSTYYYMQKGVRNNFSIFYDDRSEPEDEEHLDLDDKNSQCVHCTKQTILYLDKLYREQINRIRNSIFEFMLCLKLLCLKQINLPSNIVKSIGVMLWNNRCDIEWFHVYVKKSYTPTEEEMRQSNIYEKEENEYLEKRRQEHYKKTGELWPVMNIFELLDWEETLDKYAKTIDYDKLGDRFGYTNLSRNDKYALIVKEMKETKIYDIPDRIIAEMKYNLAEIERKQSDQKRKGEDAKMEEEKKVIEANIGKQIDEAIQTYYVKEYSRMLNPNPGDRFV